MHRCIATVLLVVFSWALAASAFANTTAAVLPACCRKDGNHKCQMHAHESADSTAALVTVEAKCPCSVGGAGSMHVDGFAPAPARAIFAGLVSHPAGSPQTDAAYRISSIRSRQKRGPPSL